MENILEIKTREQFRLWLEINSTKEKECYIYLKRGKPTSNEFCYLDGVEEALCFGWIDSTLTKINGKNYQRFSPRTKNGKWTELNKERARRLIKLGKMTEIGIQSLPDLNAPFEPNLVIVNAIKNEGVWDTFITFPELYQRIRLYNLNSYFNDKISFEKSFSNFLKNTKAGKMYGEWNDYGRLIDY